MCSVIVKVGEWCRGSLESSPRVLCTLELQFAHIVVEYIYTYIWSSLTAQGSQSVYS